AARAEQLFDTDATDADERHAEIWDAMNSLARLLGERARAGGVALSSLPGLGGRLGAVALAAALHAPYLATPHHPAPPRPSPRAPRPTPAARPSPRRRVERAFFGLAVDEPEPRPLVFTDTFAEVNGVAGTMRQLASAAAAGTFAGTVVTAGGPTMPGAISLRA